MIFLLVADVILLEGELEPTDFCCQVLSASGTGELTRQAEKNVQIGIVLPDLDRICINMISYVYIILYTNMILFIA